MKFPLVVKLYEVQNYYWKQSSKGNQHNKPQGEHPSIRAVYSMSRSQLNAELRICASPQQTNSFERAHHQQFCQSLNFAIIIFSFITLLYFFIQLPTLRHAYMCRLKLVIVRFVDSFWRYKNIYVCKSCLNKWNNIFWELQRNSKIASINTYVCRYK